MIITFYSYKGGVGRSMALANVAELLCRRGLDVLMVDFDLEAPGLERYFEESTPASRSMGRVLGHRGVIDCLRSYVDLRDLMAADEAPRRAVGAEIEDDDGFPYPVEPIAEFIVQVCPRSEDRGALSLMPAGRRAGDEFASYARKVRTFDWNDLYDRWDGERYFEWFRRNLLGQADVVLVDSRTGVTEMGGVCTYHLADAVTLFVAHNHQNLDGTKMMAESLANEELVKVGRHGRPLSQVFVPSRVDGEESDLLDGFARDFRKELIPRMLKNLVFLMRGEREIDKEIFSFLKIPYVTKYAYKESLAVLDLDTDHESAKAIVDGFDHLATTLSALAPPQHRMRKPPKPPLGPTLVRRRDHLEPPGGAMSAASSFYIERQADTDAVAELASSIPVIIQGPRKMGKSSLLLRLVQAAGSLGVRSVLVDFPLFGQESLGDLDRLLRLFCSVLSRELGVEDKTAEHWRQPLSSSQLATNYLESWVLPKSSGPFLLAMDNVDALFPTPASSEFFAMLRHWHNQKALSSTWESLDLALVTSTEPYLFIDNLHQSPFNIGETIAIDDFTRDEVTELNRRHGSPIGVEQEDRLMQWVGGHPYLVHQALYILAKGKMTFGELVDSVVDRSGPFYGHLRQTARVLSRETELEQAMAAVIAGDGISDDLFDRLYSLGLVRRQDGQVRTRCRLYAEYFSARAFA